MRRSSLLAVVGLVMLALLSCGGQAVDPEDVTVSIEPSEVVLAPGETQVFTATVEGTTATEVRWGTNGGMLNANGTSVEYTAPLALGTYVVNATSVADPDASAEAQIVLEVRGRVSAAEDTVVSSGDGSVEVRIPAGAVTEGDDLVLRGVALGEAIEGLDAAIAAVSVTGPDALEQLARLSFVVPADGLAPGTTYQVYTREGSGSGWHAVPSFNVDGRLAVITPRFSDFVMGVASTASYVRHYTLVPAFDADAFAMHFPNDPSHLRAVVGDDAVLSHTIFNGICYGMSMTAGDYFASGRPSPLVRSAADDDRFGAVLHDVPHADLVTYASFRQNTQHVEFVARAMQKWLSDPQRKLAIVTEGQRIVESIRRGSPAPVGFGASSDDDPLSELNTGHVVLAYEASEAYDAESDTLRLTLTVYDPNRYTVISGDAPTAYHDPGSITITVSGYEAGKRDPARLAVDITHRLGWTYAIDVLFMMTPLFNTAALPWSNPSLQGVNVDVTADEVVFAPAWAHPHPGASIERFAWTITHVDGGHHLHEFSTPSGGRDAHAIARERLAPGAYIVRAMAQDAQGNWSNAIDAPFSVPEDAPPPPRYALTVTPGTVSGSASEGSSAVGAFELANTGDGPVRVHSIAPDVAWLSVSSASVETLLPGAAIDVEVTMSGADLAPGTHTGTITATWSPEADETTREALVVVEFSVTAGADESELAITIDGLPSGVDADVRITGPNDYDHTLTNTTTLTLPPGTYTITANNVSSGGTTYAPTPSSQQRTVSSNTSTNATITYAASLVPIDIWFNIGGEGSVRVGNHPPCTSDCTRTVPAGEPVPIVATPATGFQFTGWADACAAAGTNTTCTITPTGYTRAQANFAQRTITINYTKQGTGNGGVTATFDGKQETCSNSCTFGPIGVPALAVLQATPASGHTFAGWGGACADAGTAPLCTLSLLANDSNKTVSARFDVTENRPPTIDEAWLRYQSGQRFECGSIIPQEYIGFHWQSSDPDGDTITHQYRVDNGTWRNRNGTSVNLWLDDKPPGTLRTLQVRAIDSHGNTSTTTSCTARVSVPPEILDFDGPTSALGYRVGETVAFAVNVRDVDGHYPSEVYVRLRRNGSNVAFLPMDLLFDQGPTTRLTYVAAFQFSAAGSYEYMIGVVDALGVMMDITNYVSFTIYP